MSDERCRQEVILTLNGRCVRPDTHIGNCSLDIGPLDELNATSASFLTTINRVRGIHQPENISGYIRCPVCETESPCETLEACNL